MYTVQVKVCYSDVSIIQIFLLHVQLVSLQATAREDTEVDLCDQLGQLPEVATDQHHTEEGQLADSRAGVAAVVAIEEECKYSHFPLATAAANFPNEKASSFLNQKLGSNFSTFSFLEERKKKFFAFHVK